MSDFSADENWKQAWSTFEGLMDTPLPMALKKLENQHQLSAEVKQRVKQLLINLPQHHTTFDALADAFITQGTSDLADLSGQIIGSYLLIELIGQGGMSSVYVASRNDSDIQKKVAIKIMHPYSVSATSMRLFNREQMALAQLNHPNIISFHHGGYTSDGTPFLVTDFVEGASQINAYIKAKKLPNKEIIKLFIKVLDAISYAHVNLIIHRDLKPSNLLVDADGRLKVVDFGIATLDSKQKEHTTMVFTPEYAAPEQLHGQLVTTQADVFSLGVVLLGLLTGEQPLPEFKQRMADDTNDEKHIFGLLQNSTLEVDLKNILLYATQSNPKLRYLSVVDLRQDMVNWLQHKPIMATKQTVIYRLKKFVSRNTAVSILLSLVFLSLLMGLLTTLQQKQMAQYEAAKANEVKLFLLDALSSSDPDVAAGKDLSVRDLLLDAQANLSQQVLLNTELHAELLQTIGVSLGKIGEYSLAIKELEQAKVISEDSRFIEATIIDLLFTSEQYDSALVRLDKLLLNSDVFFNNSSQVIELRVKEKNYLGEFESAEKMVLMQLDRLVSDRGNQAKRIELNLMLASIYLMSNQNNKIEKLLIQTLILSTEHYGEVNTNTIDIMLDLANLYENRSELDIEKSLGHLQHVWSLQNQLYQTAHPKLINTSIRLANNYKALGQDQAALEAAQQAKAMAIQLYGEDNIWAARADVSLSHLSLKSGDLKQAIKLLQAAVSVYEKHYGSNHFETNQYKTNLATYLLKAGEAERSLVLLNELYTHQLQQLGENHMATLYVQLNQIKALTALEKYNQAITVGEKILPMCLAHLGEDQVITVGVVLALGVAYFENKEFQLALKYLSQGEQSVIVRSNPSYHKGLLKQLITSSLQTNQLSQAQKYYATVSAEYLNSTESIDAQEKQEFIALGQQIVAKSN